MRVLLLTASYGSGHNAAGHSVALALARQGATVVVLDYFREFVGPRFERLSRSLYYAMLRGAPGLWALAYGVGDRMRPDSVLSFGVTRIGMSRLGRRLAADMPDAVVTVHATPAVVMSALVAGGQRVPPHTTVVTDFVAHGQWIAPRIDRYCVPAVEVAHEFVARGVPPARVLVTGVPLRPEFDEPLSSADARRELGLSPDLPVVLAMAGSEAGLGRLPDVTDALGRLSPPVQGVVLVGRDRRLAERLRGRPDARALRILTDVRDVRRWMVAADVLVTKAGGMTLAEAIDAELPMVMYGSLPGQERRNERFASRAGIALLACARRDLPATVARPLTDLTVAQALRERLRRLRRPGAAARIARVVLERTPVEAEEPEARGMP